MTRLARGVALWIALAGVPAVAACNMVTGANDVRVSDDDDDDGGSSSSSSSSSSVAAGVGGATAASGQQATGVGGATTAATTTTGTTGAGAGPTECEYPGGPYNVSQGSVVSPQISWQGFAPGSSTVSTISMQDLLDCDGTRGIDAIIIDTSQFG